MIGNCADCKNHICAAKGISCTKVDEKQIINSYSEEEHKIMQAAAFVEATYYSQLTRLEETAEFARQMGYKKLGLAFCIGLNKEAHLIKKFLAKDLLQKLRYSQRQITAEENKSAKQNGKHV